MLRGFLAWYERQLAVRPLVTKSLTSGGIALVGDGLAQHLSKPKQTQNELSPSKTQTDSSEFDIGRNARFGLTGAFFIGPVLHGWYGILGRCVPGVGIGKTVFRVVLDQFIFSPAFLAVLFPFVGVLEGKSLVDAVEQMRQVWFSSLQINWMVWIPIQFLNLGVVPLRYQVLVSNVVGVAWNGYLSTVSRSTVETSP